MTTGIEPDGAGRAVSFTRWKPSGLWTTRGQSPPTVGISNAAFATGGGSFSMLARVAQVVFTATQFSTVERVVLLLEGRPIEALGGEGLVLRHANCLLLYLREEPDDFVPLRDADTLRGQGDRGGWKPMTPADAVTYIRERTTGLPVRDLHFWAIAPGEPIEASNRRLEVMAKEVLPALR